MKAIDWNRLRRGDPVFVHMAGAAAHAAEPGVVRFVETGIDIGDNSVGIRLQRPEYFVVWPPAEAVHDGANAPEGTCWRCDGVAPVMRPDAPSRFPSQRADHDA